MFNTVGAVVEHRQIKLLEPVVADGTKALVTLLLANSDFWLQCSEKALSVVWDGPQDDIYEQLL